MDDDDVMARSGQFIISRAKALAVRVARAAGLSEASVMSAVQAARRSPDKAIRCYEAILRSKGLL